jgi:hypothetical protein
MRRSRQGSRREAEAAETMVDILVSRAKLPKMYLERSNPLQTAGSLLLKTNIQKMFSRRELAKMQGLINGWLSLR